MSDGQVLSLNDDESQKLIDSTSRLIILDFWAQWCGPCISLASVLDEVALQYASKVVVAKINIDENPETATQYGVRGLPTLLFFKDGQVVDTHVGGANLTQLVKLIEKNI